jgi:glutamate synthase domain-containing protein 3
LPKIALKMSAEPLPPTISLAGCTAEEIGQRLRAWDTSADGTAISIVDPKCAHGFVPGLSKSLTIQINGNLGDFAFMLNENAEIEVNGNIGDCAGHSMKSGFLLIRGSAGDGFGAYATGGIAACIGRTGMRCGLGLAGGDVVVRSDVGNEAAMGMTGGTLVLGNSVGEQLGAGMTGGTIFVRGAVQSLSPGIREYRLKESDTMRLSLLLARTGIRAAAKEFHVFRPHGGST